MNEKTNNNGFHVRTFKELYDGVLAVRKKEYAGTEQCRILGAGMYMTLILIMNSLIEAAEVGEDELRAQITQFGLDSRRFSQKVHEEIKKNETHQKSVRKNCGPCRQPKDKV